jgi:hypothetical protein
MLTLFLGPGGGEDSSFGNKISVGGGGGAFSGNGTVKASEQAGQLTF